MGLLKHEADLIKKEIIEYLDKHGNQSRDSIKENLNPGCSPSMIDSTLRKWRISKGIGTRKRVKADSIQPTIQKKETNLDSSDQHTFSCSVKVPKELFRQFKLISAYQNDKIRALVVQWMSEYVLQNKGILNAVFDDINKGVSND